MSTSERKKLPVPIPAPVEYAGQWVAWNNERTKIVAHGPDVVAVHNEAAAKGYTRAILQKVRQPGIAFIGVA